MASNGFAFSFQVREFTKETSTLWSILQNFRPWESVTKVRRFKWFGKSQIHPVLRFFISASIGVRHLWCEEKVWRAARKVKRRILEKLSKDNLSSGVKWWQKKVNWWQLCKRQICRWQISKYLDILCKHITCSELFEISRNSRGFVKKLSTYQMIEAQKGLIRFLR